MASDMVVALAPATQDGHALFGHNCNARRGETLWPYRQPGHDAPPGEAVEATHVRVPQARHTHAFVGSRLADGWGCPHGVNDRGVAIGCTTIHTRLRSDEPGLTGPDLVRLGLERGGSAYLAVELLTDLITRHGQEGASALLIADALEAFVLQAAGNHWAVGHVGQTRAVMPVCDLRQDWDRISRGLSDLAIQRGWWPADGCKLDFAGSVGAKGPDHAHALRRWGQATIELEQSSGQITTESLRRLLREQAAAVAAAPGGVATAGSFVVRLGAGEVPLAWFAVGTPEAGVYLPLLPLAQLPAGCAEAGQWVKRWQESARPRAALRPALAALQERLDADAAELLADANELQRRGDADGLGRLAASFMQHALERLEDVGERVAAPAGAERLRGPHAMAMAPGGTF